MSPARISKAPQGFLKLKTAAFLKTSFVYCAGIQPIVRLPQISQVTDPGRNYLFHRGLRQRQAVTNDVAFSTYGRGGVGI